MINEFSVKAKSTNKKALYAFIIILVSSIVIFAVSFVIDKYSGIVGNVGLITLAVSVLIYTKYVSPTYYYDVMTEEGGSPSLVIRMMNGKRQTTLCRIYLSDIRKIDSESAKERRAHKAEKGVMVYSYVPTLLPEQTYRIYSRSRYERSEIIVEITDEMAMLLSRCVAEAQAAAKYDDE